jgi:hypothetical protein
MGKERFVSVQFRGFDENGVYHATGEPAALPLSSPRPEGARVCHEPEVTAIVCDVCCNRGAAWICDTCGETLCGKCKEGHR